MFDTINLNKKNKVFLKHTNNIKQNRFYDDTMKERMIVDHIIQV